MNEKVSNLHSQENQQGMIDALELSLAQAKAGDLVDLFMVSLVKGDTEEDPVTQEFSTYNTRHHQRLSGAIAETVFDRSVRGSQFY